MKQLTLPLIVLFVTILHGGAALSDDVPKKVEVNADNLVIESEKGVARFKGNVDATFGAMRFKCGQMTVTYNKKGQVVSLVAKGGVWVKKEDAVARGQLATLNAVKKQLVLTGNPSLESGTNRLRGDAIEVNLATGEINVTKARGTFRFEQGTFQ